jgi:hypothetical protein
MAAHAPAFCAEAKREGAVIIAGAKNRRLSFLPLQNIPLASARIRQWKVRQGNRREFRNNRSRKSKSTG